MLSLSSFCFFFLMKGFGRVITPLLVPIRSLQSLAEGLLVRRNSIYGKSWGWESIQRWEPREGCTSLLDGMCCLWSGTQTVPVCLRQLVLMPSSLHKPFWCLSTGPFKAAEQSGELSNNLTWKGTAKPRWGSCWAAPFQSCDCTA